jgi:formamidopyrimidine-DNA glycosylase
MPEGPECKLMAEGLSRYIGNTLISLDCDKCNDTSVIIGCKITEVSNKGKLLWVRFSNSNYLMITLGMTGKFLINKPSKYIVATMTFDNGEVLYFSDKRRFGTLLTGNDDYFDSRVNNIGPDIFSSNLTPEYIMLKAKRSKQTKPITKFMMDQSVLAGVGNYLKSEILYAASIPLFTLDSGILRETELRDLNSLDFVNIVTHAKLIAAESYGHKGLSMSDYEHLDGSTGNFLEFCKMFQKLESPEGTKINKTITSDGRSTFYIL